jgi:membrane-associated phospholipid phosphatase/4-amino-4-deoxy-L-arabinose transferase-like glycosyltransferase
MPWLQSLDVALFRFINLTLRNPLFDRVMPFFSGNSLFVPLLIVLGAIVAWKAGTRGRVCVVMVALVVCLGDPLVVNTLKHAAGRPRPFKVIADAHVPPQIGKTDSFSMPSAHAANWFAATMVLLLYFRRSVSFMLPIASLVGFSRIYNGMHYPSDVLVGALLGAGYAAALVGALDALWRWAGRRWFPVWWQRLPSLLPPSLGRAATAAPAEQSATRHPPPAPDQHWLCLGYVLIGVLLLVRLAYLASGKIELSEDEAYQWLWSKHLALSYYSKPPLIACAQFLGTALWGDSELGVRFFSPVIAAAISFLLLRFFAREVSARVGVALVLIATATPLLAVGATLITIDPLSVAFWTAAMISGWRAVQLDSTRHWLWTGLWTGLGFLSKYTALLQWLCWATFFILCKPARGQVKRPGPYLALLVNALCAVPVLIWNAQHGWVTLTHLGERAGLDTRWRPTLQFARDFVLAEAGLLHPVFLVAAVWAAIAFWKRPRKNALPVYFFSMGAPLFMFYFLYTLRARVQPNWIAPSVVPLFCLMAAYWDTRWRAGLRAVKTWLAASLIVGLPVVVVFHDTDLIGKIFGRALTPKFDPLTRVRAYREMARVVGQARMKLLAEGKPVFIIGSHYGITSLVTFYLPEAKAGVPNDPLVYALSSDKAENQFYFWPGYENRKGQNAIFFQEAHTRQPPPERIEKEFESVTDLGIQDIRYRDRVFHQIQLFECRDLR